MTIYGWDSPKQAADYTRKANRKRLVEDAMHLVVPEQRSDGGVPPVQVVQSSGTLRSKKP